MKAIIKIIDFFLYEKEVKKIDIEADCIGDKAPYLPIGKINIFLKNGTIIEKSGAFHKKEFSRFGFYIENDEDFQDLELIKLKNENTRIKKISLEYQKKAQFFEEKLQRKISFPLSIMGISVILFLITIFFWITFSGKIVKDTLIKEKNDNNKKLNDIILKERNAIIDIAKMNNRNFYLPLQDVLEAEEKILNE